MKVNTTAITIVIVIFYLLSAVMFYKGFDKMNHYNGPEEIGEYVNVYVGGDAYNYIINGTHATAYYVQGVGFFISGTIILGTKFIISYMDANNTKRTNKDEGDELPDI